MTTTANNNSHYNWAAKLVLALGIWWLMFDWLGHLYGMPYIATVFISFALAEIHSIHHLHLISHKGKDINHVSAFGIRVLIGYVFCIPFHLDSANEASKLVAVAGSVFWIWFDIFLNTKRGLAAFYVSKYYKSAWVDRVFSKYFTNPYVMVIVKVVVLILTSVIYFYGGHN